MLVLTFSLLSLLTSTALADIKYKTVFTSCPSRSAGKLTLNLLNEFDKNSSLRDVKKKIVNENLKERFFISDYEIKRDPVDNILFFKYKCPRPIGRVQIYKKNNPEAHEAILVETGELFDPTYEVLLRREKKLIEDLPSLAIPIGEIEKKTLNRIVQSVLTLSPKFKHKVSELILDEKGKLTLIMSIKNTPSSIFMGDNDWKIKIRKLQKMINYLEKKDKIPAIINLTNFKKVVVKFTDKI